MASYDFDPVEWASAGAVGDPGQRTFYLQARRGGEYVAVIAEKEQVSALVQAARELLSARGSDLTSDELLGGDLNLEPVQPEWRVGALRMGADERAERFLLELDRLGGRGGERDVMRWTLGRDELAALVADAAFAVEANRRHRCRRCRRRLDPDRSHAC